MLLVLALVLVGCRGAGDLLAETQARDVATLAYPEEAQVGPDLPVHVVRDGRQIEVINLSSRSYRRVELWLNQAYARPVDRLEIGKNWLSLRRFVNDFGETYPTGTLLSPDKNEPVVLAELYDPSTRVKHRLVVRPSGDERETGSLQTSVP